MREMAFLRLWNFKIFRRSIPLAPLGETARAFGARNLDPQQSTKEHRPMPL